MKALLDSSTIIAAILPDHIHHSQAKDWLLYARQHALFFVSAHSLMEIYSVLTRLPRKPKISPTEAHRLLEQNVLSMAEVVSLTNSQYVELLELLTTANHTGGIVYDAIIARVAQLASVDALATLNPTDFLKVWPEGRKQIIDVAVQSPPAGDP